VRSISCSRRSTCSGTINGARLPAARGNGHRLPGVQQIAPKDRTGRSGSAARWHRFPGRPRCGAGKPASRAVGSSTVPIGRHRRFMLATRSPDPREVLPGSRRHGCKMRFEFDHYGVSFNRRFEAAMTKDHEMKQPEKPRRKGAPLGSPPPAHHPISVFSLNFAALGAMAIRPKISTRKRRSSRSPEKDKECVHAHDHIVPIMHVTRGRGLRRFEHIFWRSWSVRRPFS